MTVSGLGPGSYILIVRLHGPATIRSGRLGVWEALPGCYLYVGSALGPGGLAARLAHHLRHNARFHWHVDYLTHSGTIEEIWYSSGPTRWEHEWAGTLARLKGAAMAFPRFGASDCRCASHLYVFREKPSVYSFRNSLQQKIPDPPQLHVLGKTVLTGC